MSINHSWNDGGGKLKYLEKNLYQYNFFTMELNGIKGLLA
jgi:hypothetical protein